MKLELTMFTFDLLRINTAPPAVAWQSRMMHSTSFSVAPSTSMAPAVWPLRMVRVSMTLPPDIASALSLAVIKPRRPLPGMELASVSASTEQSISSISLPSTLSRPRSRILVMWTGGAPY
eukprot:7382143-Prymnesium_polylepis.2